MAPRPRRAADDHRPDAAAREESGARGVDPAAIALYRAAEPAPDRADEAPPRRRDRSAHRRGHPAYDQRDRDRAAEQRLTVAPANAGAADLAQIGRASYRDRVCQYVEISVVAVSLKKKKDI